MTFIRRNSYLFVLFALILSFSFYSVISHNSHDPQISLVQIQEGDTLWTLAESFSGNTPEKEWIEEIMKENNMHTPKIVAGQSIKIPSEQLKFAPDKTTELAGDAE